MAILLYEGLPFIFCKYDICYNIMLQGHKRLMLLHLNKTYFKNGLC